MKKKFYKLEVNFINRIYNALGANLRSFSTEMVLEWFLDFGVKIVFDHSKNELKGLFM